MSTVNPFIEDPRHSFLKKISDLIQFHSYS